MKKPPVWLIAAVAFAVVGGAFYHFRDSPSSTVSQHSVPQRPFEVGEQNGGVAYGDTTRQVSDKLGSPTSKQAACWIYHADDHSVNRDYLGKWIDALKFCFADGPAGGNVVSTISEHLVPNAPLPKTKYPPGGWIHAFNLAPPASEQSKD